MPERLVAYALGLGLAVGGAAAAAEPDGPRRAELRHRLLQDCGSCHGLTLKGGLGPPLLAESLAGKDRDGLVVTVLEGRPGTPMPPWKVELSEAEAAYLVDRLIRGELP
jgi:cytochrome c55X